MLSALHPRSIEQEDARWTRDGVLALGQARARFTTRIHHVTKRLGAQVGGVVYNLTRGADSPLTAAPLQAPLKTSANLKT